MMTSQILFDHEVRADPNERKRKREATGMSLFQQALNARKRNLIISAENCVDVATARGDYETTLSLAEFIRELPADHIHSHVNMAAAMLGTHFECKVTLEQGHALRMHFLSPVDVPQMEENKGPKDLPFAAPFVDLVTDQPSTDAPPPDMLPNTNRLSAQWMCNFIVDKMQRHSVILFDAVVDEVVALKWWRTSHKQKRRHECVTVAHDALDLLHKQHVEVMTRDNKPYFVKHVGH